MEDKSNKQEKIKRILILDDNSFIEYIREVNSFNDELGNDLEDQVYQELLRRSKNQSIAAKDYCLEIFNYELKRYLRLYYKDSQSGRFSPKDPILPLALNELKRRMNLILK